MSRKQGDIIEDNDDCSIWLCGHKEENKREGITMSFDSLLINFMRIVNFMAADVWGEPPDDSDVDDKIPCRIMYDTRLMKNYKGEEVLSAAKIFCKPEYITFHHEDQLQFDIETYGVNHPIIIIKQPQNSVAIHYGIRI